MDETKATHNLPFCFRNQYGNSGFQMLYNLLIFVVIFLWWYLFGSTASVTKRSGTFYRNQAQKYLEEKQIYFKTAIIYKKQGRRKVAGQYFKKADECRRQYEEANNRAAAAFLEENSRRNPRRDTIDLHRLYVKEAILELDKFLDNYILELIESGYQEKTLNVITGRGVHSIDGVPKVKPAVIKQLRQRGLKFWEINAGGHLKVVLKGKDLSLNSERILAKFIRISA